MNKAELRNAIRQQHRKLTPQQRRELSVLVVERLLPLLRDAETILLYHPLPEEVDVSALLSILSGQGRTVLLPRVTGRTQMVLCRYTSEKDLAPGPFGILEPVGEPFADVAAIDVAVVPGMAFTSDGWRLGRGRGYYDRFLAAAPYIYKIGVCFPYQLVSEVPHDEYDIRMDTVVAP